VAGRTEAVVNGKAHLAWNSALALSSSVILASESRLTDTVVSYTGMPRTYGIQFSYRY
jgi:hypothetical protein